MISVLMSIKPIYAQQIMAGTKKFEFRRTIFKRDVETIIVYAASPIQKILGRVSVRKVHIGTPRWIWERCKLAAGISRDEFFRYFHGKKNAYAIEVYNPITDGYPLPLSSVHCRRPPQSFCYLSCD